MVVIFWINVLAGGLTGLLSSWGLGGGTLLLIYLLHWGDAEQKTAQGINLLFYLPMALLALPNHKKQGFIQKKALVPAILGGLLLALVGVMLGNLVDSSLLRRIFGGFLILLGVYTLLQKPGKKELEEP